jgi:hypothetical protein
MADYKQHARCELLLKDELEKRTNKYINVLAGEI